MAETDIYLWTDRTEQAYAVLRAHGGHWRVAWGYRDPPGGDNYLQLGEHETGDRDDAVRLLLDQVRTLSGDRQEAERVERNLGDVFKVG